MIVLYTGTAFAEEEVVASGEKYTATRTSDGWIKVVNDGGATLGYSENSGISLIEDDGYAFKDFTGSGVLETYEDWRLDAQTRADDLASKLSGEEIAPLLTHGGWSSFGSDIGADEDYLVAGGRAGVTRSAGTEGNEKMAVKWNNALQEYAEGNGGYGIPVTTSIDPNNIDDIIDQNSLAATMDAASGSNELNTDSATTVQALRQACKNILYTIANSGYYAEGADVSTDGLNKMQTTFYTVDAIVVAAAVAMEIIMLVCVFMRKKKQQPTVEIIREFSDGEGL